MKVRKTRKKYMLKVEKMQPIALTEPQAKELMMRLMDLKKHTFIVVNGILLNTLRIVSVDYEFDDYVEEYTPTEKEEEILRAFETRFEKKEGLIPINQVYEPNKNQGENPMERAGRHTG